MSASGPSGPLVSFHLTDYRIEAQVLMAADKGIKVQ